MAPPSKKHDPDTVRYVMVCDALRRRYRRNAAPYRQCRTAEILGVPQSAVAKTLQGQSTTQIRDEDRAWVFERDAQKRYWDEKARYYRPAVVARRLRMCLRTYYYIVATHRERHTDRRKDVTPAIHAFLTGRRAA